MAGLRVFSSNFSGEQELILDAAESHHLVRVRRARVGAPVEIISGKGHRAQARLVRADGRAALLAIDSMEQEPPAPWRLTLAQALPKGKTMDAVVQRATELGADRIVPLFTAQSDVELDQRRAEQKRLKWEQTALESAKQCGNPWLPEIAAPQTLELFLLSCADAHLRLVAALVAGAQPARAVLAQAVTAREVVVLIGPEGDFSPAEYSRIHDAGFAGVSLGPRVLRVETAVCALLTLTLDSLRARSDAPER